MVNYNALYSKKDKSMRMWDKIVINISFMIKIDTLLSLFGLDNVLIKFYYYLKG